MRLTVTARVAGPEDALLLELEADTSQPRDASIVCRPLEDAAAQPETFGLPSSAAGPFTAGTFVAAVSAGASINCPVISSLCAHSNGTHTECVGHALPGAITLEDIGVGKEGWRSLVPCLLLTVSPARFADSGESPEAYPSAHADDLVVTGALLEEALREVVAGLALPEGASCDARAAVDGLLAGGGAVAVRTLPNDGSKRQRKWTGSNPPYVTRSAAEWLLARGAGHALVDLPSFDREDDEGLLIGHRTWWGLPPKCRPASEGAAAEHEAPAAAEAPAEAAGGGAAEAGCPALCRRTITELCFFPQDLHDGLFLLNLQVAPIALDAAPSRPLLFPLRIGRVRPAREAETPSWPGM